MAGWNRKNGVTLVEMLVVLGVIMVLGGFVVALTRRMDNQSKEHAVANAFTQLSGALQEYYDFRGRFPVSIGGGTEFMVKELRTVPAARQVLEKLSPALVKSRTAATGEPVLWLCDPWGTELNYAYVSGDNFPELISAGPDKQLGTADDISSKGKR